MVSEHGSQIFDRQKTAILLCRMEGSMAEDTNNRKIFWLGWSVFFPAIAGEWNNVMNVKPKALGLAVCISGSLSTNDTRLITVITLYLSGQSTVSLTPSVCNQHLPPFVSECSFYGLLFNVVLGFFFYVYRQ